MYVAMRRLLIILALITVANVASISPIIAPASAQQNPGRPPGPPPPGQVRPPGRDVPAPLLGVGWPALALAGAALAGYRLRQRFKRTDESAAETQHGRE